MDTQPGIENEHLLWAYIDGQCLPAEKEAVELRLLTDPSFKAAYESLLALHHSLPNAIELSAPSLRFSKNVMEEIGRFAIAPAMKTYINKKIIYGIAGFVLGLMVVLVGFALATRTGDDAAVRLQHLLRHRQLVAAVGGDQQFDLGRELLAMGVAASQQR